MISDFDLAYAYEALARAFAIAGDRSESERFLQAALEAGEKIKGENNKTIFFGDLKTVPGYTE